MWLLVGLVVVAILISGWVGCSHALITFSSSDLRSGMSLSVVFKLIFEVLHLILQVFDFPQPHL